MRNNLVPATIILAIFAACLTGKRLLGRPEPAALPEPGTCRRIVSMAPSITETLYALGLQERVVGVSRFCQYPPEAQQKPKVGGFHNPNFEAVFALRPDLVVMLTGDRKSESAFAKLGLGTLVLCHNNVEGILDSFGQVGRLCNAEDQARRIVVDIEARLERIRRKTAGLNRPRVMVVVQRTGDGDRLEHVCVAGTDGFFDKMIELAGGRNAFPSTTVRFPRVSIEGILWVNPQVILDMTAGLLQGKQVGQSPLDVWRQLADVEAVKTERVHPLVTDYAFVPGPRFILLVEELARRIHPEVDWRKETEP